MIVVCPKCQQKFRVPDEQIQPKGVKVRCGRCRTVFGVRPAQPPETTPPPLPEPPDGTDEGVSIPGVRAAPPFQHPARAAAVPDQPEPRPSYWSGLAAEQTRTDSPLPGAALPPPVPIGTESSGLEPYGEPDFSMPGQAPERTSGGFTPFPAPVSDAFPQAVVPRDTLARWLASFLVVLVVLLGFFAFVAARNDWLLDLKELDQMVAVAFKGQAYQPREVRIVRVYDLNGEILEQTLPAEAAVPPPSLLFQNLRQSLYRTRNQVQLVLVEGDLLNTSSESYRRILVGGTLLEGNRSVAIQVAPVGGTLSPENLEEVSGEEALEDLYRNLAGEVAGLVIQPNQLSRFTLVFVEPQGYQQSDEWTYQAQVVQVEHAGPDGIWWRSTFNRSYLDHWDP